MKKFRVYLTAVANLSVEVEAEDGDDAVDKALSGDLPYASAFCGYDLEPWSTPSEVFGSPPKDDYLELG